MSKKMPDSSWLKEFPGAVTVCDTAGIILSMNDRAAENFQKEGGLELIGKNLLDCHPEPSRGKLAEMLQSRERNVYSIEKQGKKKLIYQSPWYRNGEYAGFVELSLDLPPVMPNLVRDQ